jgi:dihydropyrimidinase
MLEDASLLDVMAAVAEVDGILMVHAENGTASRWNVDRLSNAGRTSLSQFAEAYPSLLEREAIHRVIALAELAGARLLIVHVSSADGLEQVEWARRRGLPVHAETCPHYLLELGERLAQDDWETAKYICSPPIRGSSDAEALWKGLASGMLDLVSSDHCPYRFAGENSKRGQASVPDFRDVPPGLPGLETRLPLLFEGVTRGRLDIRRFVELTATRPAKLFGLHPQKGDIVVGGDADLAIWERGQARRITHGDLHDANDHTPFEGLTVHAWPIITLSRGEAVWNRGAVTESSGRGRFVRPGDRQS